MRRTSASTCPAAPHSTPARSDSSVVRPMARSGLRSSTRGMRAARRNSSSADVPDAGRDRAAQVRAALRDAVERGGGAEVHHDRRHAVERARRDRVGEAVGAHRAAIVVADRQVAHGLAAHLDRRAAARAARALRSRGCVSAGTTEHSTAPRSPRARRRASAARSVSAISSAVWRVDVSRQKPSSSAPSKRPTTMSLLPMSTATSSRGRRAGACTPRAARGAARPSPPGARPCPASCRFDAAHDHRSSSPPLAASCADAPRTMTARRSGSKAPSSARP